MKKKTDRYPLYLSVFGNLHKDIMEEEPKSIFSINNTSEQEIDFDQNYSASDQEEEEKSSNENLQRERIEPGGFLVTPMGIDDNPFAFEEGFEYSVLDWNEFKSIFKQMRDANATVRIPDEYEGFSYNFNEKFGYEDPAQTNQLPLGGSNNSRGRGRGGNSRGRGRGRGGSNNSRGRGRGGNNQGRGRGGK